MENHFCAWAFWLLALHLITKGQQGPMLHSCPCPQQDSITPGPDAAAEQQQHVPWGLLCMYRAGKVAGKCPSSPDAAPVHSLPCAPPSFRVHSQAGCGPSQFSMEPVPKGHGSTAPVPGPSAHLVPRWVRHSRGAHKSHTVLQPRQTWGTHCDLSHPGLALQWGVQHGLHQVSGSAATGVRTGAMSRTWHQALPQHRGRRHGNFCNVIPVIWEKFCGNVYEHMIFVKLCGNLGTFSRMICGNIAMLCRKLSVPKQF